MSRPSFRSFAASYTLILAALAGSGPLALAQAPPASLSEAGFRPFVVGVVPVVGNGAVGGVSIDARGVVQLAEHREVAALRDARRTALEVAAIDVAGADVMAPSKLRKISLRRLDAQLARYVGQNKPLAPELLYLAGLQRIQYVLAYPQQNDVVLAGPAECWLVDAAGNVIGQNSGAAVMQLEDLIAALRTTDKLLAGEIISCSIDPTPEGLQRFNRLLRGNRATASADSLRRMEQAVGPQEVKLTGVPADSHFAQVLVAADWKMKRLGMGLAPSPVAAIPSYVQLLADHPRVTPRNALPRWWIAFGDGPVDRDPEGLAWRISPPGIEVRTAAAAFDAQGQVAAGQAADPLAQQWAAAMTTHFDELSLAEPVFAQLRGCMDLALATAVLTSGDLLTHVGLELPMLLDPRRLQLAAHPVPKSVPSHANAVKRSRGWIVTVSGGVELDVTRAVHNAAAHPQVREIRTAAAPPDTSNWWWD